MLRRALRWARDARDGLRWTSAYLRRADAVTATCMPHHVLEARHLRIKRHAEGLLIVGSPRALHEAADMLQVAALEAHDPEHCVLLGAMSAAISAAVAGDGQSSR